MPYHHGNLRSALVDAAVELASTAGPEAVALREVARSVGVSHNAAYRHFTDRDALIRAVAARALSAFGELMAERIAGAATGRGKKAAYARLSASGRAYVEFATGNTGLFRTACSFPMGTIQPDSDVDHPYLQLSQRLDELVAVKAITQARRANAEIAACSAVHGFAMLTLDGPFGDVTPEEREAGLDEVLRVVQYGI